MQQLNYFTLRALTAWLQPRLAGALLAEAFSQTKDELVLGFACAGGGELYLRMGCRPQLPYLVPIHDFKRARSNVASLFAPAVGQAVTSVALVEGERVVVLALEGSYQLILKLHGGRSNALLLQGEAVQERFRQLLGDDARFVLPSPRPVVSPDLAALAALPAEERRRAIPTFDAPCWRVVQAHENQGVAFPQAVKMVVDELTDGRYHVSLLPEGAAFWLLHLPADTRQPPATTQTYSDIAEALGHWLRGSLGRSALADQKAAVQQLLAQAVARTERALSSVATSLEHLATARSAEELANLLMANLHIVEAGAASITVTDFYTGGQTTIALEAGLTAQETAARLYARHRENARKLEHLRTQKAELSAELLALEALQTQLAAIADRRALQAFAKTHVERLTPRAAPTDAPQLPYHTYYLSGFEIRVGKDARRNDELTQRYAHKDDLWLHAKDVPGSHVVLRHQPGRGYPEMVVELAAGLAAWFSKRRQEGLVPVTVTPRKYVRKTRHLPPGAVLVEREDTVLVEPLDPATLAPEASTFATT